MSKASKKKNKGSTVIQDVIKRLAGNVPNVSDKEVRNVGKELLRLAHTGKGWTTKVK